MDEKPTESAPPESAEEAPAEPVVPAEPVAHDAPEAPDDGATGQSEPDGDDESLDEESILFDDDDDDEEDDGDDEEEGHGEDDDPDLPELFGLPPTPDDEDEPDVDDLIRACRHGIHESNNALTGLIQECELAAMSDDPERLKLAIERISTQADALARINRGMRVALGKFPAGR